MAIIESKGKGYSLFNGVKLASLPEWGEANHPYAVICRNSNGGYTFFAYSAPCVYGTYTVPDGSHTTTSLIPADGSTYKNGALRNNAWRIASSDSDARPIDLEYAGTVVIWSNFEIADTITDNSVYLSASEPITLDGMNVIEWDGDTEGLELFAGTTNFWRVSNAVDVDTEKGFVEAHINEMHGTISGNIKAPLVEKEGYWELLPIRYVPAASEAYPTTGVYFIETKLMQPRLFAYYPIEPAEPDTGDISTGIKFLIRQIFDPVFAELMISHMRE